MVRIVPMLALGLLILSGPALAATGRQVPTETIVVPTQPGRAPAAAPANPGSTGAPAAEATLPKIEYDPEKLPPPVRRLREQIIESATSGEVEQLRPVFDAFKGEFSIGDGDTPDPILALKKLSGDDEGREVLAIVIEILQSGYIRIDVGTPQELYVWPYFYRYPIDTLTPRQLVELFKIVTAGDVEEMRQIGAYDFFRVGISPDGTLRYITAGD